MATIELSRDELEFIILRVGQAWEESEREGWLAHKLVPLMREGMQYTRSEHEIMRLHPDDEERNEFAYQNESRAMRKLFDAKRAEDEKASQGR